MSFGFKVTQFVRQLATCSPEGIRTPDLFLEGNGCKEATYTSEATQILTEYELIDAPDGPSRPSEKRPTQKGT